MSNNDYAKVVLDSVGPNGKRLITVEARYWRAIHAEFMTHRDRARNAASSRAIPFYKTILCPACKDKDPFLIAECQECGGTGQKVIDKCSYSYIRNDSFFPEFMGTEQKGMQSGGELVEPNRSRALGEIEDMRDFCLIRCMRLHELGLHKSLINRYLEPWSYITIVTTATEWKNLFRLRVHPKAEKHFQKVAAKMKAAIEASTPQVLEAGEWHMPYLRFVEDSHDINQLGRAEIDGMLKMQPAEKEEDTERTALLKRISAARCARLSYLTQDGRRDLKDDIRLFDSLIHPKFEQDRDDDVIHSSPLEHVGQASDKDFRSGPFDGWLQFRKQFPNENVPG